MRISPIMAMIILLAAGFIVIEKKTSEEFESRLDDYTNATREMNSVIKKYNKDSTLSVERLNLINRYLNIHEAGHPGQTLEYIEDHSLMLRLSGIQTAKIKEELEKQSSIIISNIEGFEQDLEKLNNSILISYTSKTRDKYRKLCERIREYT